MSEPLTEFDYLLNAFERASQAECPADLQYGDKRRCLIDYVRKLERRDRTDPGPQSSKATARQDDEALFQFIAHGDARHRTWLRDACRAFYAGQPRPPEIAIQGVAQADALREAREIRKMLCVAYAGATAYMDDGEAQDNRANPCIDFLRDSPDEIRRKMRARSALSQQIAVSESTRCWHCGKKLVGKNGTATPPLIFATLSDPLGNPVRVHKVCVANAGLKPLTAQPSQSCRPERDVEINPKESP